MLKICMACNIIECKNHTQCVPPFSFPSQQSSKVYKRHSSVIPSSHLLVEVQETTPSLDGSDFEPGQCYKDR